MAHKLVCDNFYPEQKEKTTKATQKVLPFYALRKQCEEK